MASPVGQPRSVALTLGLAHPAKHWGKCGHFDSPDWFVKHLLYHACLQL